MYSVILFAGMTAGTDVPQELFPNRPGILFARPTGCSGTAASRPRPLAAFLDRRHRATGCAGTVAVAGIASGCSGSGPRLSYGCAGATFALPRATGCSGGGVTLVSGAEPQLVTLAQTGPLVLGTKPTTVTLTPTQPEAVGAGGFIQRVAIHRNLHKALRQGTLTPEQAAIAKRALEDSDVYEAAVSKVTRDLNRNMQAKPGAVGAFGDGHILQLLLDNLPKIISAIAEIIKLFG